MLEIILLTSLVTLVPMVYFSDESYCKGLFSYFMVFIGVFTIGKLFMNSNMFTVVTFGSIFAVTAFISNIIDVKGKHPKKVFYLYIFALISFLWITDSFLGSLSVPHYVKYYLKHFLVVDYIKESQKPFVVVMIVTTLISLIYTCKHKNFKSFINSFLVTLWLILIVLEFFNFNFSRRFFAQSLIPNNVHFGISVDAKDKSGYTKLARAINDNNLDEVKSLIKRGADINLQFGLLENTPIAQAVARGNYEIFKFLLEKNADYTIKNKYNLSPLSFASKARNEDTRFIKDLINLGANKSEGEVTQNMDPPLHLASQGVYNQKRSKILPKLEVIRLLIGSGEDVNGISAANTTPLYKAVQSANFEGMRLLIELGADPKLEGIKYPSLTSPYEFHDSLLSVAEEASKILLIGPENQHYLIQHQGYKNIINYLQDEYPK